MSDSIIIWYDYAIFFDIMGKSEEIWEDQRQSGIFRQNMHESNYRIKCLDFCPQQTVINIWQVYCEIILSLQDITTNRAISSQDYINSVDEWQVAESLQDLDIEPDVPYPLIDGRALFGGDEYLSGVNEGRGLGKRTIPLV